MVLPDQKNAIVRRNMKINDKELNVIIGGGIGATFINYLTEAFKTIYNIGQDLGGAIRRIASGKTCPV